jgi:hypothetical protein
MRRFTLAFILLTFGVFLLPLIVGRTVDTFGAVAVGIAGAFVWFIAIMFAVNRYGVRAYWLSLTALAGLFWPLFLAYWFYRAGRRDPHWMMP